MKYQTLPTQLITLALIKQLILLIDNKIEFINKIKEGLKKDFSATNPEIVEAFINIDLKEDSDAVDAVNTFGILSATSPPRKQEAANRLSVISAATEVASQELLPATHSSIVTRINEAASPMPYKASKPAKTFVNIGTSLTLKYHMMEYGIAYDAN